MAFQTSALPGLMTAASEMCSGMSNAMAAPWRVFGQRSKSPQMKGRPSQVEELQLSIPAAFPKPATTLLPAWVRDLPPTFFPMSNTRAACIQTPFNIRDAVAGISRSGLVAANHFARRAFIVPSMRRQLSTTSNLRIQIASKPFVLKLIKPQSRLLFGNGGRSQASHAMLSHAEELANKNPNSATVQGAFYTALQRANMPAIIIERYQSGQFARNSGCDGIYQKALASLGQTGGSPTMSTQLPQNMNNMNEAIGQAVAAQSLGIKSPVSVKNPGSAGANGNGPLKVIVEESWGSIIYRYVRFFVIFAVVIYVCLAIASWAVENISGGLKKSGFGKFDSEAKAEHQNVKFTDVHGCDEAKEELQELVAFLKDPAKFSTLGGKLPKGILLVGPPGTGKTLLARAVAGEAGVPYFFMSGSEFDEVYVGIGARRVRELFGAAKAKSPAIIFIDELDAIGSKRNTRDAAYHKQTLNQLLTELDGFEQNSGIIILAATNFPELLDKALTRPGRFDRNVVVDLPDVRGRMAILKHHLKKIALGTDVKVEDLAAGTPGFSGADLENVVNQAAIHASKIKSKAVSMLDLEWAKDKVLMGAEKRSMVMSTKEKEMTAYHEAGHALIGMFNPSIEPLYKVTIMPRGASLGMTMHLPEMDKYSKTFTEYQGDLDRLLAGKVAEELIYGPGNVTSGCASDLNTATKIAYAMVTRNGMSSELGNVDLASNYDNLSNTTKQLIESEVRRLIEEGRVRATQLLQSKRKELDLLAKALLKYETLNKEEAFKVIKGEKLDGKLVVTTSGIKVPSPTLPGGSSPLPDIPGSAAGGAAGEGKPEPPRGGVTARR